jgi:3-isopropylmalate dehydrogenase
MQLVKDPGRFDVMVTTNMFGDILSDLASELVGGLGQAPSANINPDTRRGLFEPVHGSAPKHAGKGIANPVGAILAGAMMLRHFGAAAPADQLENAVMASARDRRTTRDLGGDLTTRHAGEAVLDRLSAKSPGSVR